MSIMCTILYLLFMYIYFKLFKKKLLYHLNQYYLLEDNIK